MEKYPILNENQVALIRAAFDTGHVLDEYQRLAINNDQKVYTVFENVDDALIAAREIINGNKNIECVIYDKCKYPYCGDSLNLEKIAKFKLNYYHEKDQIHRNTDCIYFKAA